MEFYDLWRVLSENAQDPEQSVPPTYVSYTGVVLPEVERNRLLQIFKDRIPPDWDELGDHMTINVGPASDGPAEMLLGKLVELQARSFAIDEKVAAVRVETKVPSANHIKHITIATNPAVGTAKDSNTLQNWKPIEPFTLRGIVKEVERAGEPRQPRIHTPQSAPAPNDPVEFVAAMSRSGKPQNVIRQAMKGKFPQMSDEEIGKYV